jgi:hypothetical protein
MQKDPSDEIPDTWGDVHEHFAIPVRLCCSTPLAISAIPIAAVTERE